MGEKRVRKVTFIPPLASLPGKKAKRKVAAYARVSTAAEEQESSLIAQRTFYEKHIRENPEWEFVEEYSLRRRTSIPLTARANSSLR